MSEYQCQCTYEDGETKTWTARWEIVNLTYECTELCISGRGSSFHVVLGDCISGKFMCIPGINKGCALSKWSDTFWNTERISTILNKTDAVTIAIGLNDFYRS